MAEVSGIDPRYAAQFQRGFDPAQHEAPPARRGPARLEGGPPPTAERVPDPPPMSPTPALPEVVDAEVPDPAESPGPAARTWWDWLLPGVGVGLIVIALALWWSLATDTSMYFGTGDDSRWSILLHYARYELAGPVLMAGVLALTAGLVLQAMRVRR